MTVQAWRNGQKTFSEMSDEEILACFRSVFGFDKVRSIRTEKFEDEAVKQEITKEQRRKELQAKREANQALFREKQMTLSTLFT